MTMEGLAKVGDRVIHVDNPESFGRVVRGPSGSLVIVRWESTGRESAENLWMLVPVS